MGDTGDEFAGRPFDKNRPTWRDEEPRPHIRPPISAGEIIAIIITIAGWLFTIIPLAFWWSSIPDTIASHFNIYGQPDAFGPKTTLLIYPAIATGVTLLFQALCRFPWIFNYPVRITPENAARQYVRGRLLLRWVNATIWLMGGLQWQALQVARGAANTLGPLFSSGLVIVIVLLVPIAMLALIIVWATRWK